MKLFDLSGRVAVVTGGNGGIGLGMAKGMAAAGAAVVVAGRDAAKNAAAVKELQETVARVKSAGRPGVLLLVRTTNGNAPIVLPFAKSE